MTKEEMKNGTFIASAEIRLENTSRRDALVESARKAGFLSDYSEAFDIFLSGGSSQPYWYIRVYSPAKLDRQDVREARLKLAAIWKSL